MRSFIAVIGLVLAAGMVSAQSRYVGYYYPEIASAEVYDRVLVPVPKASAEVRVDFVTNLTKAQLAAPESPRFVFFTKGDNADQLVVVALDDQVFKTLFRARAVLAQMTSNVRGGDFFKDQELQFVATFYDMLQMLGFETLVISDGEKWAHQVSFVRR
jgi:hypothetical protein